MRIRTASDVAYTSIAWLPLLVLVVAIGWVLCSGLLGLEKLSFGTEYFIGNHETTNMLEPIGGSSDEQLLQEALASGDVEQMEAALQQVEERNAALAGGPGAAPVGG